MRKMNRVVLAALAATTVLVLVACGNSGKSSRSSASSGSTAEKISFPIAVNNKKPAIKGGTLTYGLVTNTPFKGIFSQQLSGDANDATVMIFGAESLFKFDNTYKLIDGGAANIKLDQQNKTAAITINPKVKWSDGQPLTANDVLYAYKIVANPTTKAQTYSAQFDNILGMADYSNNKAKEISGIQMPDGGDGRKVVIHFKEMKPAMQQSSNGYFLETAAPYHYLKDVPFKDLMSSDKIRKKPLFFGPFMLSKLIAGQSAVWTPNPYYYGDKPKLSKITIETVSPATAPSAVKAKKYDILAVSNSWYEQVKGTKGITFVARLPMGYSYLAFKVGKWDGNKGINVENPKAKMNNAKLRQAIAYAMNQDDVYTKFAKGLSFRIPTLIPSSYGDYFDKSEKGFPLDLDKANKLLDEAGYKKGSDGYRTDPQGKKLTINFATMSGTSDAETIAKNYIQQWKKIGLRVEFTNGRLLEFNSFYDKVRNDSPDIDMLMGGWALGPEPSPNGLYSADAQSNYSRFNTAENTKLINDIDSQKAFDHDYRVKALYKWQAYMNQQAYVVPLKNSWEIVAVNNRVIGYGMKAMQPKNSSWAWADVGVSSN